jgi:predicted phage gp36 major capsid-like protein
VPKRHRPSPPASKDDIEEFANLIGGHCIRAEQQIAELEKHMEQWKEDLGDQVEAMIDQFRRDLDSANRDEVQMLKERLQNVEQLLARFA